MKKLLCLVLSLLLVFSFAACGGSSDSGTGDGDSQENAEFVWTRVGDFADGNDNYVNIEESDDEDHPGWMVSGLFDGDLYGWYIQQEGNTLKGDLTEEGSGEPSFVVTISEEGEDGILVQTEAGAEYHLTPMEPEE